MKLVPDLNSILKNPLNTLQRKFTFVVSCLLLFIKKIINTYILWRHQGYFTMLSVSRLHSWKCQKCVYSNRAFPASAVTWVKLFSFHQAIDLSAPLVFCIFTAWLDRRSIRIFHPSSSMIAQQKCIGTLWTLCIIPHRVPQVP